MKNLFLFTLFFAGVILASCGTKERIGEAFLVDTTIKYTPGSKDYAAQRKKQTYLSPKGNSTKKPSATKKDTVVIVEKVMVVKETAPTPKPKAIKKAKVAKAEPTGVPTLQESQMLNFDAQGQKPYNAILFK